MDPSCKLKWDVSPLPTVSSTFSNVPLSEGFLMVDVSQESFSMTGEGMLNELNVKALTAEGNSIIIVTIHVEEESFILVIHGSNIQGLWNCEVSKLDYAEAKPQING
jgi:hypothetical protein